VGLGRKVGAVDATLTQFRTTGDISSESYVGALREALGPRFGLVQVFSRSGGQTAVKVGGSFLSNPIALGVDYDTTYAPFSPTSPFVQALALNARVLVKDTQLQFATYTLPNGATRYTISGSRTFYRGGSGSARPSNGYRMAKYIVRGKVIDMAGEPVRGAALRVDKDDVLTDDAGRFFVRSPNTRPHRLEVTTDAFVTPGHFEVVDAPTLVSPETDENAADVIIAVRRVDGPASVGADDSSRQDSKPAHHAAQGEGRGQRRGTWKTVTGRVAQGTAKAVRSAWHFTRWVLTPRDLRP
jgi:hypothetical protein